MKPWQALVVSFMLICSFGKKGTAQTSGSNCGWLKVKIEKQATSASLFGNKDLSALQWSRAAFIQDADSIYTIPVVVHVIHTGTAIGAPDNPSDASINAMISSLNDSWRKNGSQYGGADMKMQFKLANRSPQCGATTGIVRINGSSIYNYNTGGIAIYTYPGSADEWTVKGVSRWSNTDYINIWIVNKINGSTTSPGGFAYFAEYNNANTDGIVVSASCVNGFNKTIAHEMGHVFNLYHTFYDDGNETQCPRTDSCSDFGDRVCDTEPDLVEYYCANTINACTGLPYLTADVPHNYSVLNNYMNYTNCALMFSEGQKTRARNTLFSYRHGLISSGGINAVPTSFPAAACAATADNSLSPYYGIEKVNFNTLSVYSNSSLADSSFYIDRSCNQRTTVFKGQQYPLEIIGSYENSCWIKAFLDYNNDGDFNDAGESLVSTFSTTGHVIVNLTIPSNSVAGVPLRLRIVADAPGAQPTACHLTGDPQNGAGQIEDYGVIVAAGTAQSAASGPWTTPGTWDCNCIPQSTDQVTIKAGHTVSVNTAVQCASLNIQTGAVLNVNGNTVTVNR
ncbi:MAG: hypothetical protein JWQ27_917 [Ferruginibacter sp.]|nr:hypothetical protein [Ferruginibacter sp.]